MERTVNHEIKSSGEFLQTSIGLLPPDWEVVQFHETCFDFFSGGIPSTKKPEFWDGNIAWTTSAYLNGLYLKAGQRRITEAGLRLSASCVVPAGNVLVGTRVGVGKASVNLIDIAISQDLTGAIVNKERFVPEYLVLYLQTDRCQSIFALQKRGATIKGIPREDLYRIEIAAPPLSEQRAIAALLSKIQVAIEFQEKIIATLKELKAATMAKLFREGLRCEPLKQTEIGEIPESWEVAQVKDLFTVELGKMLSPKARKGINPRPYLRNKNVQWGRFDLSEVFLMDFTEEELDRFHLKPGDILVCEGGEPGRTAVWQGKIEDCCYQKALHRLRPKNIKRVLPRYYLYWATAAFTIFKSYKPTGTKTTIAHLPKEKLEVMEIALPMLPEQARIVKILDNMEQRLLQAEHKGMSLRVLFSSMLHLLMTGQVRVNYVNVLEETFP